MAEGIKPQDLVIHILNVGHGDNILIGFPAESEKKRRYGLVDCFKKDKTIAYLDKVYSGATKQHLLFVCATHPHKDHIEGIKDMIEHPDYSPDEFWDSGFRHTTVKYRDILVALQKSGIEMIRVASGMEKYFGKVRITVLSPSVTLRNKYATYGIDVNNASIVLRIEHHAENVLITESDQYTGKEKPAEMRKTPNAVAILAGDAEFDAWAQVVHEFPILVSTSQERLVKKMVNFLNCGVLKVSHHGSMHSAPLDVYEKMKPATAVISCKQDIQKTRKGRLVLNRGYFPHQATITGLEENSVRVFTTDGSYEGMDHDGGKKDGDNAHPGSVIVCIPPGGKPRCKKLDDTADEIPEVELDV